MYMCYLNNIPAVVSSNEQNRGTIPEKKGEKREEEREE